MSRSRVSIALATYNGAQYLQEQLDTLARQRLAPAELVVSDDGSSDQTLELVERFATTAKFPVRIHRNERRLGYRANFLQAASLCRGDLIAFCDQDDLWHESKLSNLQSRFDDPNLYLAFHNAAVSRSGTVQPEALITGTPPFGRGFLNTSHALYNPQGFTQIFRSNLCRYNALWPLSSDHHWPDLPMAHDQWFFFLARLFGNVDFDSATLATYRIHANNTYGWNTRLHARYHALRALASPGTTSVRKLAALLKMQEIAGLALAEVTVSPHASRARHELNALVATMQARSAMFSEKRLKHRFHYFRVFLANDGYGRLEAMARTSPSRVLSDFAFLLSGPALETAVRSLVNQRSQNSAAAR